MKPENAQIATLAEKLQQELAPKEAHKIVTRKKTVPAEKRRSVVFTPQVIAHILSLIEQGYSERQAAMQAGITTDGWAHLKQRRQDVWDSSVAARAVARKGK